MLVLAPQKFSAIYEYIASVHLNGGFFKPPFMCTYKSSSMQRV